MSGLVSFQSLCTHCTLMGNVRDFETRLTSRPFFQNWLSDLEIFTALISAIIHDYDHTGTTNNFHINSESSLAILYNDRAVLENHHVSEFFRSVVVGCGTSQSVDPHAHHAFFEI